MKGYRDTNFILTDKYIYKFKGSLMQKHSNEVIIARLLRKLKINAPKETIINKKHFLNEMQNETNLDAYYYRLVNAKSIIKMEFVGFHNLMYNELRFTDKAAFEAGKIMCAEFVFGIFDRHLKNYRVLIENNEITNIWTIDFELLQIYCRIIETDLSDYLKEYANLEFVKKGIQYEKRIIRNNLPYITSVVSRLTETPKQDLIQIIVKRLKEKLI